MVDNTGRTIEYLRISVTDRCNLRCVYCMPENGVVPIEHSQILRLEEIIRIVRIMTELGVKHLRLTGGEPMARRGCLDLAEGLHRIPGIESISLTSNGLLLKDRVHLVKKAGITSLNMSIDSPDPDIYRRMTRGGEVKDAMAAVWQALEEGLTVKINAVPVRGYNDNDLTSLALLSKENPVCVRFIELMPIGCGRTIERIPFEEVKQILSDAFGEPLPDEKMYGHGPARYVRYPGFTGSTGFISALSHEFCDSCNRVRLTADGQLKLCLNHTKGLDLRSMLRSGRSDKEILEAIGSAIAQKPRRHAFYEIIDDHEERCMNSIGG